MRVVVFVDHFGTKEIVRVSIEPEPMLAWRNSVRVDLAKQWLMLGKK